MSIGSFHDVIIGGSRVYQPVHNHHPYYPEEKCYPELIHLLTQQDIGKYFVRAYPRPDKPLGIYIWDYIPKNKSLDSIREVAIKFLGFTNNRNLVFEEIHLSGKMFLTDSVRRDFPSSWNDGHWVTAEEFYDHIPLETLQVF